MMEICNWTSKTVPRTASEETPGELEVCEWSDEASSTNGDHLKENIVN